MPIIFPWWEKCGKGICFTSDSLFLLDGNLADVKKGGLELILNRGRIDPTVEKRARDIVDDVRERGFEAVKEYTKRFDCVDLGIESVKVSKEEIDGAYQQISDGDLKAIRTMIKGVGALQKRIKEGIRDIGIKRGENRVGIRFLPIKRVGVYVPGGKAPLISSLIMAALPARIAGVEEIIVLTPPKKGGVDPRMLVAAREVGVKDIYKIGGAQAIGALAYGLNGVLEPVDMIAGPGNIYVQAAKGIVEARGEVKIDLPAGPSEVLVIADKSANPKFIAADLLAQAEHGRDSSSVCICLSKELAEKVGVGVKRQIGMRKGRKTIEESLRGYGALLTANDMGEAIRFANRFAPEHLELYVKDAEKWAKRVENAGAIFIKTGEVFGDYGMSGGNHVLPTGRTGRFSSGISVLSFMRYVYEEKLGVKEQKKLSAITASLARMEGLDAHENAALVRK